MREDDIVLRWQDFFEAFSPGFLSGAFYVRGYPEERPNDFLIKIRPPQCKQMRSPLQERIKEGACNYEHGNNKPNP
jgi:hypothetical protein